MTDETDTKIDHEAETMTKLSSMLETTREIKESVNRISFLLEQYALFRRENENARRNATSLK